jgi:hypothetical protein
MASCFNSADPTMCGEFTCDAGIVGLVEPGGACTQDAECTVGVCFGEDTAQSPTVDGVCAATRAIGEPCEEDSDCETDYCSVDEGTCAVRLPSGSDCTQNWECESNSCVGGSCEGAKSTCTL